MGATFFQREVKNMQKRFNETIGRLPVCNLDLRYSLILSICWMEILNKHMNDIDDTEKAKEATYEFIRIRDVLDHCFTMIEKQHHERRDPWQTTACGMK
jgi:hypothetical protein